MESFENKKVTIMGLGLNGGGLASALFFLNRGADVTVTDLRDESILAPTMKMLEGYRVNYTLGKHIDEDFLNADIVIKNPGVRSTSEYLKMAKRIESDISIFLNQVECPIIAVTGSKGKSSTVSAIYHVLKNVYPDAKLGGNITVSPLSFIDEVTDTTPVVLELSSWQLADLKGKGCLKPVIAAITNIMNDHQNAYNSLDEYAEDKAVIFENSPSDVILNYNDSYRDFFKKRINGEILYFSGKMLPRTINSAFLDDMKQGWMQIDGRSEKILDTDLAIKGEHQRENLLLAALILKRFGVETSIVRKHLAEFSGIAHRMEMFFTKNGVKYYNDSAATIPEAVNVAINSFDTPLRLISGGTDKELEFECIKDSIKKPLSIHLLQGSGTDKMIKILEREGVSYYGPFSSLKGLIENLIPMVKDGESVLFSPGATSFGMFNNEFDRGNQFKNIISSI